MKDLFFSLFFGFLGHIFGFSPCTFRAVYFRVEPRTSTSAQKCDAEHDVKYTRPNAQYVTCNVTRNT